MLGGLSVAEQAVAVARYEAKQRYDMNYNEYKNMLNDRDEERQRRYSQLCGQMGAAQGGLLSGMHSGSTHVHSLAQLRRPVLDRFDCLEGGEYEQYVQDKIERNAKPKTLREELQQETNEWLKGVDL